MITQTYDLDIIPGGVPVIVHVHQNDITARAFALKLYSRNGQLSIPVGASAYVEGIKPDGKVFSRTATLDNGVATVDTFDQMTVLPGEVRAQLKILNGEEVIIAANFSIMVERDLTVNADTSETDIPGLVQQAQAAAQAAQDAASGIDTEWFVSGAKNVVIDTYNTDSKLTAGAINELRAAELADAANITDLQSDMTTAEGNITSLRADLATAQGNISTNTENIATNTSDITSINADLTNIFSQLAGGYIEDSSITSTGGYVRWSNGFQICWVATNVTDIAFNLYTGGIYLANYSWTFPKPFTTTYPIVSCGEFRWGTSASWGSCGSVSLTTATLRGYDAAARAAGTNVAIKAMAIGMWK